jgi:hypothetical protein
MSLRPPIAAGSRTREEWQHSEKAQTMARVHLPVHLISERMSSERTAIDGLRVVWLLGNLTARD